jgi:hypothetical protein
MPSTAKDTEITTIKTILTPTNRDRVSAGDWLGLEVKLSRLEHERLKEIAENPDPRD